MEPRECICVLRIWSTGSIHHIVSQRGHLKWSGPVSSIFAVGLRGLSFAISLDAPWIENKCCITCGFTSCLDDCYDGDINNVPPERLTPFNCTSDISPNSQDTCQDFKSWGDCNSDWMQNKGHCCASCPQACNCPYNSTETTTTTTTSDPLFKVTHEDLNCEEDIAPPPDPGAEQSTCLEQYRWNNCDETWMRGYCCLTASSSLL